MTAPREAKASKACFVIAPIGEAESETRKRSDQILKHVIAPAVESCGYTAVRADQISEPGLITTQVIQRIVDDPLVVADLTERNPNVFYELAIRHAIRKPLIQLIEKGHSIPFDIANTRTISIDHRDLDSVEEAKDQVVAQIKALETKRDPIETPISVAIDLQSLRQSDNADQRSLADVLSRLNSVSAAVARIEERLPARGAAQIITPDPVNVKVGEEEFKTISADDAMRLNRLWAERVRDKKARKARNENE